MYQTINIFLVTKSRSDYNGILGEFEYSFEISIAKCLQLIFYEKSSQT